MSISEKHISYKDFIENEIKTLGFLQGYSRVGNSFSDLSQKAQEYFYQYKGKKKSIAKTNFVFSCDLDLVIEKKERRIILEAMVTPGFSLATYVMSICEGDENSSVIRKFHFDYDPKKNQNDKKPIYHLQYGGKQTKRLNHLDLTVDHLQSWLSVPRINSLPINLALLLDMVFSEFPSEQTKQIIEPKEWRDLIKQNEDLMLKEYYYGLNRFLSSNHRYDFLLREYYYGK